MGHKVIPELGRGTAQAGVNGWGGPGLKKGVIWVGPD